MQKKNNANNNMQKIVIPLNDQTIQKAKACQEMIMYERVEQNQLNAI